jgi:transposase
MELGKVWIRRSVAEKRRVVELSLEPGMSVARVAQAEGINSHQVFQWRRLYRCGELGDSRERESALLPVVIDSLDSEAAVETQHAVSGNRAARSGSIHIELPTGATIRVDSGADRDLLCAVLESLRK